LQSGWPTWVGNTGLRPGFPRQNPFLPR
jgi:hypothetical protein